MAKVLQKHAGRAKERILQNLGKADRTTDEDFDLCVKNFTKQQNAVLRLQKEFKNYHQCLKAMQASQKSLMDTVCELYEPCWVGLDRFLVKAEDLNKNFDDFCDKINNHVLNPVTSYMVQFPEYNNKISKRNRKLLDYDNCRHNLQNLETMRKREEVKIAKAKEQLEEARTHFELINTELHDELPALYDSRVSFFVSYLQCLYLAEAQFHNQASEIFIDMNSVLEALDEDSKKDPAYRVKQLTIRSQENEQDDKEESFKSPSPPPPPPTSFVPFEKEDGSSSGSASGSAAFSTPPTTTDRHCNPNMVPETEVVEEVPEEEKNDRPAGDGSTTESVHPRFLYKVKGTFKYAAEDSDELSFNVGDIIDVISYEDPEEQEEGWLMGVFNGKKGLFPANFTSPI